MTNGIAIVTAVCWLATLLLGRVVDLAALGGFIPARVGGDLAVAGAVPAWLTPLTATLIHADLFHLGFNLLMLVWCGRQVESAVGGWMLALIYLIGAYAAAFADWAFAPGSMNPAIGASGSISAVLAVYALVFSEQQVKPIAGLPLHVVRALWLGLAWIGIQALIGLALGGAIGVAAHVGGFLAGLLLARPLLRWRYRQR